MFFGLVKEGGAVSKRRKAIRTILVVEDEPLVAFDNEHTLAQAGYRIAATVDDHDHAVLFRDGLHEANRGAVGDRLGGAVRAARHCTEFSRGRPARPAS